MRGSSLYPNFDFHFVEITENAPGVLLTVTYDSHRRLRLHYHSNSFRTRVTLHVTILLPTVLSHQNVCIQ